MRNSSILKWNKNNNKNNAENGKEKKWLHSAETLTNSNVVYLVKFLGSTEVDKPKGIDVVKQGIQKLKFNQQLKKSESGSVKPPKVELTVSVDGVVIQEPKTKKLLHKYPLHKISYCADDKAEKRFFSFIAKEDNGDHTCFVFVSDKLAEEITLTIGQAFELAYKKFLDTSSKDKEAKKAQMVVEKRLELLEAENAELKKRLKDIAVIKGMQNIQEYMRKNEITDITEVRVQQQQQPQSQPDSPAPATATSEQPTSKSNNSELINLDSLAGNSSSSTSNMDGLTLDDLNDDDFNPRAASDEDNTEEDINALAAPDFPPPPKPQMQQNLSDIFSREDPFNSSSKSNPFTGGNGSADPFGMATFEAASTPQVNNAANPLDQSMANAFQAAFSFEDLDPLNKKK